MSKTESKPDCKYWRSDVLKKHKKASSRISDAATPAYLPPLFATEWEIWKQLPQVGYSADVSSLYDMTALSKELLDHPCAKAEQARDSSEGVSYPGTFYMGLVLAGLGVVLSFAGGRK
jgi:hypothetical protein